MLFQLFFITLIFLSSGCFNFKHHHHRRRRIQLDAKPVHDPLNHKQFPVYKKNGSKRDFALYLLKKYHPDGYYIIQRYEKMVKRFRVRRIGNFGKKGFMVWARGKGRRSVINGLGTMVHESNHSFTSMYPRRYFKLSKSRRRPWGFRGYGYYINREKSIIVQFNRVFPARKIRHLFPKSFHKGKMLNFRFTTYVYPSSRTQSTQVHGIFGLLDEFNSYYHGCQAHMKMLPYYKTMKKNDYKGMGKYFSNVNGTRFAYHEFKLFILLYMIKAKISYPHIYQALLQNKPFLRAFLTIEKNYSNLLNEYQGIKSKLKIWLKKRGHRLEETESSIFIKKRRLGRHIGYGHFNKVIAAYDKELAKPKYRAMMKIMAKHKTEKVDTHSKDENSAIQHEKSGKF